MTHPADLQEALRRIAQMANTPLALEQFFQLYLQAIAIFHGFRGCAIWGHHSGEFALFGGSDTSEILYESSPSQKKHIQDLVSRVGATLQPIIAYPQNSPSSLTNESPLYLLFVPMLSGLPGTQDPLQGVQLTWLRNDFPPDSLQQAIEFFSSAAGLCALVLRNNRLARAAESLEQVQRMVKLLSSITGEMDLETLGLKMVNLCHEIIGCKRCAIFLPPLKGKEPRLLAISHMSTPEPKSALLRSMAMAAKEIFSYGSPSVYKKKDPRTQQQGNIGDFFYYTDAEALAVIPMKVGEKNVGMLLAEFQQFEGEDPHRLNQALSVAHHCAPALYSADQLNALPFYRQLRRLHNFLLRYPTLRSFFFRKRFLIPTLVTFFLCFFPWSHDLTGDCTIYPIQRVQVVSEVSGILNHIYVQNGQAVSAQQPLAQLDDLEIRRQLEVLGQEANRYRTEADHYRSLDNRAQARIAEMNLERVRSQIAFWQDQLRKTTLRAPMEGILYAPQLKEALGTLIQPGTQLAIVGVPSSWELVIKVPESDIALLTSRLLKGQSLSVRFLLSSLPTQKFHAQITSLSQVSPIAEVIKNRNCFQIRVPLPPSDSQQKFRYGFEGRAKIHLGTLPAGYLLMRAFLNWLRIHVLL